MDEIWVPVYGFEDLYEVSNLGRIRNKSGHIKAAQPHNFGGYLSIKLYKSNVEHSKLVHTVVLESFVGPKPEGLECRHLDGVSSNCRLDNLVWDTHSENMKDTVRQKTNRSREQRKLTDDQVREIRSSSASISFFMAEFGIGKETIRSVRIHRTYQDVV